MKTYSFVDDEDYLYDQSADIARGRARNVTNALLDEIEATARNSRRRDSATLNRINSVLQSTENAGSSKLRRPYQHKPPRHARSLSQPPTTPALQQPFSQHETYTSYTAEDTPYISPRFVNQRRRHSEKSEQNAITSHLKTQPSSKHNSKMMGSHPDNINALHHEKISSRSYRAHSHPPGHAGSFVDHGSNETSHVGRNQRSRHYQVVTKRNPYLPPQAPPRPTISQQRKEIERRLDNLLDYEMPSVENFQRMRGKLRDVNEKMLGHKLLLDRYSGVELAPGKSVEENVQDKYHQLVERMPELENYKRTRPHKSDEEKLYYDSPHTTIGYSGSLTPHGPEVSELRGRIRRLVCRSKNNPHYYRI